MVRKRQLNASVSLTDRTRAQILELVQQKREQKASDLRLPSESELCRELGVSRITVRRAVDQLVEAGDIVRHHGRGTFAVLREQATLASPDAVVGLFYRPEDINEYTGKIIAALDGAARRRGMTTAICSEVGDLDVWKTENGLPSWQGLLRGYISNAIPSDQLARLEAHRIPTICLNNPSALGKARYVIYEGPDNFSVPFEWLLELGHQHVAYVGPNTTDAILLKAMKPFRMTLKKKHPAASLSLVPCGSECFEMQETVARLIEEQPHITGLLVYDDLLAAWLINAFQANGRRVPEDISVIAFNSFTDIRASLAVQPQITCMELRYDEIAELAMELFVQILQGTAPDRKRVVTVRELIERGSVAAMSETEYCSVTST